MLEDLPEEVLHARGSLGLSARALSRRVQREDEVDDVERLLLDHVDPSAGPAVEAAAIARTVAIACLGDDHLWQDLQLRSRTELSALMRHWFPALVEKNRLDMKWKKFLYRQLCEREEILICKAPTCAACGDQSICYGPEA